VAIIALPLVLVAPAVFLLIRPLERRIRALSDTADRFGQGDLETRAPVDAKDALAGLAGAFNRMAERIGGLVTGQRELLHAVSHELRTPLARAFFILDDAETAPTVAEKNEHLKRAEAALADLNDLVEELLTFVRLEADQVDAMREDIDVDGLLNDVAGMGRDLRADVEIKVEPSGVRVRAVPRYFKRAVLNLVTNAVRHANRAVTLSSVEEARWVEVFVDDDGPGVPPEDRARVFEPFTRVDSSRSAEIGGVGLGLAIVARVVALHGGEAAALDGPNGGARFRLRFPRV
jgi:signal transduction histidine kinase